jgi:2-methylcitrate dehydratase PrpD
LVRCVDLLDSYLAVGGLCHPSDNFGTIFAVAYEIQCRFTSAVPVMAKGFNHATQLAISAAAGAGKLFGLSASEIANAISIATIDNVSLANVHAEPVSQWKGFSPGMTGMRAVYAASLAKRGFTGPKGLFEGLDDQLGPAQLDEARIQAPDVQALLKRVEIRPDDSFSARYPHELSARITIHTKDQRVFVKEQNGYEGGLTNPMS